MSEPSASKFTLTYDGDEYDGEMPARELAGVLVSLSDYAQGLSRNGVLPAGARAKVGTFADGSFEIQAILEVVAQVGVPGVAGGGFAFWWKCMRRVAKKSVYNQDLDVFEVTFMSNEVVHMTPAQWKAFNDKRFRRAMGGFLRPLKSGATTLKVDTGDEVVTIERHEANALDEAAEEVEGEQRYTTWAWPLGVAFDGSAWKLGSRDLSTFFAKIEDERFLQDVAMGRVRIGQTDSFKIAVRVETTQANGSTKTRRFIERVIDHHVGAEQDTLPVEDE